MDSNTGRSFGVFMGWVENFEIWESSGCNQVWPKLLSKVCSLGPAETLPANICWSARHLEDVLKTSSAWKLFIFQDTLKKSCEYVFKTSSRRLGSCLQCVFKTSSRCLGRYLQCVFKTSSRCLGKKKLDYGLI